MADPEIETRRPREGRCERCDRPLTDEDGITQTALDIATAAQGLSPAILAGDAFRDGARHGLLAAALAVTRVHHQAASLPTVPSAAVRALAEAVRSIEAFDRCVAPMFAEESPDDR